MVGFKTLQRAQALGDFESLDKRDRRGVRVHFLGDVKAGLAALADRARSRRHGAAKGASCNSG